MRIVLDSGMYDLRNTGNVALLQVAARRLTQFWPDARIEVLTSAPHLLRLYFPNAFPVSPDHLYDWTLMVGKADRLLRSLPVKAQRIILELREVIGDSLAAGGNSPLRAVPGGRPEAGANPTNPGDASHPLEAQVTNGKKPDQDAGLRMLQGVDLYVATGAQYMSESCKGNAMRVLDRLETAAGLGITTAMVGLGLNLFDDSQFRSRACAVLPFVDLIFIRDPDAGLPLLRSMGIDPSRVVFTGDDGIELAYEARAAVRGTGIGIGLPIADCTGVADAHVETIRRVVQEAAKRHNAELIPLPVSSSSHEQDHRILPLLTGRQWHRPCTLWRLEPPIRLVETIQCCRVVVTGAFHPAVFALAQGIPAVCLAKSSIHQDEFMWLARQFGPGCQVLSLDGESSSQELAKAIDMAWHAAYEVRSVLLSSSVRLIRMGRSAYRQLYALVESRQQGIKTVAETAAR
ncbi:MAG: polysaccharide pyruvyl transferase family protein [Acidobacteriales bacterium]|nr:polysaccharide pyruvyl transferase family protein [Terriglobales bacterium]